jgi:hypothetical protein
MIRESKFQADLIKELECMFPGCIPIVKPGYNIQGFPDLLILYKNKWAALECKRSLYEHRQPNQEYFVEILDDMSFSSFICPENKEEVLNELQQAFTSRRATCFSKR